MDQISAFMDGEARRREARRVLIQLKQGNDSHDTWNTFHLIGDVMRGEPILKDDFTHRLRARIEEEPTVLARRLVWRQTANLALSAAASCTAVAVVLTLVFTDNPLKPQTQLTAAPNSAVSQKTQTASVPAVPVPPRPIPAANQAKVNEYLMAHQEFSPSTILQGLAPYVRTVSAGQDSSDR